MRRSGTGLQCTMALQHNAGFCSSGDTAQADSVSGLPRFGEAIFGGVNADVSLNSESDFSSDEVDEGWCNNPVERGSVGETGPDNDVVETIDRVTSNERDSDRKVRKVIMDTGGPVRSEHWIAEAKKKGEKKGRKEIWY